MNSGFRAPRPLLAALASVACVAAALLMAAPAGASFGVASFDGSVTDALGQPYSQAGGHPFAASTTIDFNEYLDPLTNQMAPDESVRDMVVDLPAGFIGNPTAVPACSQADFSAGTCAGDSQVGIVTLYTPGNPPAQLVTTPVVRVQAPEGHPPVFGFVVIVPRIRAEGTVRVVPDYGMRISLHNISESIPLARTTMTLWGVPADPAHDAQRYCGNYYAPGCSSSAPVKPFLTNPTSCTGPVTTTLTTRSWQHPDDWKTATFVTHDNDGNPLGPTGCSKLDFAPSLTVKPDVTTANTPGGLTADLSIPSGLDDPNGLASADLKKAVVTLPPGVSVNPGAADGLAGCSPSQIDLTSSDPPSCPDASKIGTVKIDTPLLDDPLEGNIYIAKQNDNPFGSLFAVYVSATADGITIKLPGKIDTDPSTGQVTTTFDNNPQLPFDDLKLTFWGGSRGVIATPEACRTYSSSAVMTPWSGNAPVSSSTAFPITGNCMAGFSPLFRAGVADRQAGASSPFTLSFSRSDTDEYLSSITATLPPGLLAKVAGVPLCTDAQANAATCPAASQVGTVSSSSGPGSSPLVLPGKAFLTGPYKGAPYGLAVAVPAVAGPFDLGTVVVRQALHIDPNDAHVTAVSDPFPTIIQGVPLRLRRIDVTLDRPGFMQNPTSCAPMKINAVVRSVAGSETNVSSPFQAAGCQALPFEPTLQMSLTGKSQTRAGKHPGLDATVSLPKGDANIAGAKVTLPLSLALDPNNANGLCEYSDGLKNQCPQNSIVGMAEADTPLLNEPLRGPVYFVKGIRFDSKGVAHKTLPTLLIPLKGENGVELDLRASSAVNQANQLVTTFSNVPDAPISQFKLAIAGGQHGILAVTGNKTNICSTNQTATQQFDGQNGKTGDGSVLMQTPCRTRVIAHKPGRSSVRLTIQGVGPGTVTVSGKGIKTTRKHVKNSTVTTLSAKLTKAGKRMRSQHKKFHLRAKFTPAGSGARVRHSRVALRLRAR